MGTEAIWIPVVMAAVGTAASVYNTRLTAKKQDNALAAQVRADSQKAKEADDRTRQLIDQTAASDPQAERAKALQQYTSALASGGQSSVAGLVGPKGATSSRYAADAADAALGVSQYGQDQAGLFSTIDAAKRQRDQEGFNRARTATDLDAIARRARAQDFILGLKARGITRNPWIDAGASLLTSAAGSMAGNTGGGAGGFDANAYAGAMGGTPTGSLFGGIG
jgi:hypothetical protein